MDKRLKRVEWGPHGERKRTSEANWNKVISWNRAAAKAGERRKVFVASLADVFDNHKSIRQEWRDDLWALIRACKHLDFLLLTKRPQNIRKYLPEDWGNGWPNVWLGTTVENQEQADRRIPILLEVPAAVHFLSCEPLLGEVRLSSGYHDYLEGWKCEPVCCGKIQRGYVFEPNGSPVGEGRECCGNPVPEQVQTHKIDWVICGGESGPGSRPMHPDWARSLREQCKAAGVPFFFKQWGEWLPWEADIQPPFWQSQDGRYEDGHTLFPDDVCDGNPHWQDGEDLLDVGHTVHQKVGKKRAGRQLDGKLHDEFP